MAQISTDFEDKCAKIHGIACTDRLPLPSSARTLGYRRAPLEARMTQARLRNFVNGRYTDPCEGGYSEVVDPSTGQVYAHAPVSTAAAAERSRAMLKSADAVERRAGEFIAAETRNTGKPVALAVTDERPRSVDQLRFFAGAARVLEGRSAGEYLRDHTSMIRREPIGVCAQVTPWNYPLMMAVWKIAPALPAGNTVVLKPSDTTPVSTLLLAEVAAEFFPPGVLNVICGDRGTGRAMIAHDIPAMASITGSVRAGTEGARTAADGLKRVHLELGGKAPVIVFDDADVGEAARGIAAAGYYNAGQDCTPATRVLAAPGIAADLTEALAEQARATTTGGLDVTLACYGPLNSAGQLARVAGFLDRVPAHATVHAGGHPLPGPGYLFEPTVVSGLGQGDELVQDEVFGPVITVQRFTDEDQAVRWANDVKYGLGSSA